ncbi:MAG: hypothetical protein OEM38_04025 [Gammaproteobacteria bacterium]|nr:hypothetical protein [Gammaproteobacteria bacterium]
MNEHKKSKHIGIGGIKCPCCGPLNTGKKNKRLLNKESRRNGKRYVLLLTCEDSARIT